MPGTGFPEPTRAEDRPHCLPRAPRGRAAGRDGPPSCGRPQAEVPTPCPAPTSPHPSSSAPVRSPSSNRALSPGYPPASSRGSESVTQAGPTPTDRVGGGLGPGGCEGPPGGSSQGREPVLPPPGPGLCLGPWGLHSGAGHQSQAGLSCGSTGGSQSSGAASWVRATEDAVGCTKAPWYLLIHHLRGFRDQDHCAGCRPWTSGSQFFFWPHITTCGILVRRPGMEPTPSALGDQSLNHGATREAPGLWVLYRPEGAARGHSQALPPPEKTQRLS